jgi:hypothetical protein
VIAADMTAQQVMDKQMNCPACKPFADQPQVMSNIRYNMFPTKTGFASTFMMADATVMPAYRECEKKCQAIQAELGKMSDADAKEKLCPFCYGMKGVTGRKDVSIEMFPAELGTVTVATATTPEGTKALHDYAKMAQETSMLLSQAMMDAANTEKMGEMK